MKAGEVFLGDYTQYLTEHPEELPAEAKDGPYALGATVMVAAASLHESYRLPNLAEWFPARVCLPPPHAGQWYRWYDPFIWYETDGPISAGGEKCPPNMGYCGKTWYAGKYGDTLNKWIYPIAEWRRLFGASS